MLLLHSKTGMSVRNNPILKNLGQSLGSDIDINWTKLQQWAFLYGAKQSEYGTKQCLILHNQYNDTAHMRRWTNEVVIILIHFNQCPVLVERQSIPGFTILMTICAGSVLHIAVIVYLVLVFDTNVARQKQDMLLNKLSLARAFFTPQWESSLSLPLS